MPGFVPSGISLSALVIVTVGLSPSFFGLKSGTVTAAVTAFLVFSLSVPYGSSTGSTAGVFAVASVSVTTTGTCTTVLEPSGYVTLTGTLVVPVLSVVGRGVFGSTSSTFVSFGAGLSLTVEVFTAFLMSSAVGAGSLRFLLIASALGL